MCRTRFHETFVRQMNEMPRKSGCWGGEMAGSVSITMVRESCSRFAVDPGSAVPIVSVRV